MLRANWDSLIVLPLKIYPNYTGITQFSHKVFEIVPYWQHDQTIQMLDGNS